MTKICPHTKFQNIDLHIGAVVYCTYHRREPDRQTEIIGLRGHQN